MSQSLENFSRHLAKSQALASSQISPVSIADGDQFANSPRCSNPTPTDNAVFLSSPGARLLSPMDDTFAPLCNENFDNEPHDYLDTTFANNNNNNNNNCELEVNGCITFGDATITNNNDFNILDYVSSDQDKSSSSNNNNKVGINATTLITAVTTTNKSGEPDLSESDDDDGTLIDINNDNNNNVGIDATTMIVDTTTSANMSVEPDLSESDEDDETLVDNNNNPNQEANNQTIDFRLSEDEEDETSKSNNNNNQAQQITTPDPVIATTANPNTSYIPELYDDERDDPFFNNNNNNNINIKNISRNHKRLKDHGRLKRTSRPRHSIVGGNNKRSKGGRGYEKNQMICDSDPKKSVKWFEVTLIPVNNYGEAMMRNIRPLYQRLAYLLPDASFVITTEIDLPGFDDGEPVDAEDEDKDEDEEPAANEKKDETKDKKKVLFKLDPKLRYTYDILIRFNVEKLHANKLRMLMTRFLGLTGPDRYTARNENGNQRVQITACSQGQNAIQKYTCDTTAFIYGINQREVNAHWRIAQYAKIRKHLKDSNPILVRHKRDSKSLRETFKMVRDLLTVKPTLKLFDHPKFNDWRDAVVEWWNTMVKEGKFNRFCQLYLWGPSSTGKTTIINQILNACEITEEFRYIISNQKSSEERFLVASYKKERFVIAFWDENRIWKSIDTLKKVLAGEPLATEIKGGLDKKIIFDIPIIMVSNVPFEKFIERLTDTDKEGLRQRVVVVEANGRTYEDERNTRLRERIEAANYQHSDYLPAENDLKGANENENGEDDDDSSEDDDLSESEITDDGC